MLHPVVPPDSVPVQEYIKPSNFLSSHAQVEKISDLEQELISNNNQSIHSSTIIKQKNQHDVVVAQALSSPVPETLPPEFSPLNVSKSAALLGNSLAVGDIAPENINSDNIQNSRFPDYAEVVNSDNQQIKLFLSQLQPAVVIPEKKSHKPKNINIVGKYGGKVDFIDSTAQTVNIPSSVLVQNVIEFKPRDPNQQPSIPRKIEIPLPKQQSGENTNPVRKRVVEVVADRQEYDQKSRVVTAEGNAIVRFDGAVLDADRLQVNLNDLIAVGEGNVSLTRGDQVFRGDRFTYNFVQDSGNLDNGTGEVYIPTTGRDLSVSSSEDIDITASGVPVRLPSDRIRANQPTSKVSSPGGVNIDLVGQPDARNLPGSGSGGTIKRMRFEAKQINFYPRGWQAQDVRITNDPFSPPELELRASEVTLTKEAPLVDRITTRHQRLVFDQNFVLPIPIDNQKLDRRERDIYPFIVSPGFDNGERGGFYVERGFSLVNTDTTSWGITPQFFVQRALENNGEFADFWGVESKLNMILNPKTSVKGKAEITTLYLNEIENNLRANIRLSQDLGDVNPHILNVEYNYRDRLYNGTLGFQTVQSSFGGIITSPVISLGQGVSLTYQGSAQYINANTDRQDLLETVRANDRVSLGRLQGSVALSKGFPLWQGKTLASTATEGLKYTPNPVVPYLQAIAGVTGTTSYYTSGDNQSTLIGTVGLIGQIGNFSRPFLDYTGFNISYSQGFNSGLSPFFFDRSVDTRVLNAGLSQQIYGPFWLGFQTSVNLDTGQESSTDYTLEYNRRTYGITLRYNPVLELGGFSIRISDFNWTGGTDPFSDGDVNSVVNGVRRGN